MGSIEMYCKYHECCLGNGTDFMRQSRVKYPISNTQQELYYLKFSLLCPCYSKPYSLTFIGVSTYPICCYVQIVLLKHVILHNWLYTMTQFL